MSGSYVTCRAYMSCLCDSAGIEFARGIIQKRSFDIKENLPTSPGADENKASFTATHEVSALNPKP